MKPREQRCAVCGRILYYTLTPREQGASFCPDRPCMLYPPVSTSKADDPTRATLIMAIMEDTKTTAHRVNQIFGKSGSYTAQIMKQQTSRWQKAI